MSNDQQELVHTSQFPQLIIPDTMIGLSHFLIQAFQIHHIAPEYAVRKFHEKTLAFTYYQSVANLLLSEELLSDETRRTGYIALLLHDVLKYSTMKLPDSLKPTEVELIYELNSAESILQEAAEIWEHSNLCRLCQLYDKTYSCLFSIDWIEPEELPVYRNYLIELNKFVKAEYGELDIISIAQIVIEKLEAKIVIQLPKQNPKANMFQRLKAFVRFGKSN